MKMDGNANSVGFILSDDRHKPATSAATIILG
jgi:hypothetical protein